MSSPPSDSPSGSDSSGAGRDQPDGTPRPLLPSPATLPRAPTAPPSPPVLRPGRPTLPPLPTRPGPTPPSSTSTSTLRTLSTLHARPAPPSRPSSDQEEDDEDEHGDRGGARHIIPQLPPSTYALSNASSSPPSTSLITATEDGTTASSSSAETAAAKRAHLLLSPSESDSSVSESSRCSARAADGAQNYGAVVPIDKLLPPTRALHPVELAAQTRFRRRVAQLAAESRQLEEEQRRMEECATQLHEPPSKIQLLRDLLAKSGLVHASTAFITSATATEPLLPTDARQAGLRSRERVRDWALGPLTGHRVGTFALMAGCMLLLYGLQQWLWPRVAPNRGFKAVFANFSGLWLSIVAPSALGTVGALLYKHNDRLDEVPASGARVVFWRVVSRGTNRDALAATVEAVRAEMDRTSLFPYVIEVVTDVPPRLPPADDLQVITVPDAYTPPNGSKFKARALHYALTASVASDKAWLVHLDEETRPTSSGIKGIAAMVLEEERSGRLRIGQGALLYHRLWREYPLLTLADNVRTGDDLARFFLQHVLGVTVFGLHGSYIVVRNDVEREVGFDFGVVGSITEDAFWALVCMQNGRRSRWVDGYLEEQATQSVMDFIKQRRRWFHGLALVCAYAPVRWTYRAGLIASMAVWTVSPLATVYTIANLFVGASVNWVVRLLANFSVAFYCTLYVLGAWVNLDEMGGVSTIHKLAWCAAQLALVGVFSLLEAASVVYAMIKPEKGFHVVNK